MCQSAPMCWKYGCQLKISNHLKNISAFCDHWWKMVSINPVLQFTNDEWRHISIFYHIYHISQFCVSVSNLTASKSHNDALNYVTVVSLQKYMMLTCTMFSYSHIQFFNVHKDCRGANVTTLLSWAEYYNKKARVRVIWLFNARDRVAGKSGWWIHDDVIKWKHFRVTGPLCGESIGHRLIPLTRPMTPSFDVFVDLRLIWGASALIMTSL